MLAAAVTWQTTLGWALAIAAGVMLAQGWRRP